jgi:ribosomal protein S28E/S33
LNTSKARLQSLRITFVTLCTVLVAGLGFTSVAAAEPPTRQPFELPTEPFPFQDEEGNDPCGFPVLLEVITNKQTVTTFTRRGVTSFTGPLKVRLINTAPGGRTIERNISGPTRRTENSDGSVTQVTAGPGLWAFEPEIARELPRMAITKGRTVSVIGPEEGEFTFISQQGSVEDICAALAAP